MKAERSSVFAFLTDSSDVAARVMSKPFRLLIRSSLMFSHWAVSKIALACSNMDAMNFSFIVFGTIIMKISGEADK